MNDICTQLTNNNQNLIQLFPSDCNVIIGKNGQRYTIKGEIKNYEMCGNLAKCCSAMLHDISMLYRPNKSNAKTSSADIVLPLESVTLESDANSHHLQCHADLFEVVTVVDFQPEYGIRIGYGIRHTQPELLDASTQKMFEQISLYFFARMATDTDPVYGSKEYESLIEQPTPELLEIVEKHFAIAGNTIKKKSMGTPINIIAGNRDLQLINSLILKRHDKVDNKRKFESITNIIRFATDEKFVVVLKDKSIGTARYPGIHYAFMHSLINEENRGCDFKIKGHWHIDGDKKIARIDEILQEIPIDVEEFEYAGDDSAPKTKWVQLIKFYW